MPRGFRGVPEKSKDFKGSIKRLFDSLSNFKNFIVFCLILAFISAILALVAPNKLSDLVDTITLGIRPNISENIISEIMADENITIEDKTNFKSIIDSSNSEDININYIMGKLDELPEAIQTIITPKINMERVKSLIILLGLIYIISALLSYLQTLIMTIISNKYAYRLRNNVSIKINKLPLKYFDSHETGDILSRVTNDIDTIAQNMNHSLATLVTNITLFLGSLFMMIITNWIMAITAIASSLIGFSFMAVILKKSQKYFTERQIQLGNLNGYIEEIYSGHNVVKAYNGEKEANENFNSLNNKLYNCNRKSQFLSGIMQPIMLFVGNFGYVCVCIVGALLAINNIISFGVIVAFMIYVKMFSNPLSQMAQAMTALQSTVAASERVFEFLDESEMKDESKLKSRINKSNVKGEIEFSHVKFGYDKSKNIIKDFSVSVKPGQKVAIVGPTGAGKTTLVNLLMKFYEINDGDITIDGISIKDLTRENVHDLFTMILQDTWLFEGTVEENLKFNKTNVTKSKVKDVIKEVGIDHFIKTLPKGLDTNIDNSDSISQGQKQLLTIARGMVEDSPFLILDEATSNVDTRTEVLVQEAMDKLTKGKTSFIIAHRLSTIKNADLILVMNNGNIVEQGTHEELLSKNGFYAELYNSQFDTLT